MDCPFIFDCATVIVIPSLIEIICSGAEDCLHGTSLIDLIKLQNYASICEIIYRSCLLKQLQSHFLVKSLASFKAKLIGMHIYKIISYFVTVVLILFFVERC